MSDSLNAPQPFIYGNGAIKQIPTRYNLGYALSINDHGQVVGNYRHPTDPRANPSGGYLYSGGKTYELNSLPGIAGSGTHISWAMKINNPGQILATGTRDGTDGYFLLSPVK